MAPEKNKDVLLLKQICQVIIARSQERLRLQTKQTYFTWLLVFFAQAFQAFSGKMTTRYPDRVKELRVLVIEEELHPYSPVK